MKSSNQIINATYHPSIGARPVILTLGQRQLEKSSPDPAQGSSATHAVYVIPIDLLRIALGEDEEAIKKIKSLRFAYRKRGTSVVP